MLWWMRNASYCSYGVDRRLETAQHFPKTQLHRCCGPSHLGWIADCECQPLLLKAYLLLYML